MSEEELKTELEGLRNEYSALKREPQRGIRLKVSEKGAVSIYGMGRLPVTLYKEQCRSCWICLTTFARSLPRTKRS